MSLQNAIERSLAEQLALVRSYDCVVRTLRQWSIVYDQVNVVAEAFGDETKSCILGYIEDIRILEGSLQSVVDALNLAESSRVDDPKRGTKICPLDAISRGVLGVETGTLVNLLRMQGSNLESIVTKLTEFRSAAVEAYDKERAKWISCSRDSVARHNQRSLTIVSKPVYTAHDEVTRGELSYESERNVTIKTFRARRTSGTSAKSSGRPPWSS